MLRPIRIRHYLAVMRAKGILAEEVLRGTRIDGDRLHKADYLIDPMQCQQVITNMIRLSKDAGIGFEVGTLAEPQDLGIIGYAVMSCPTMRETLGLWTQYGHSLTGIMSRVGVEETPDSLIMHIVAPTQMDPIYIFCVEEILVMMYKIGGILSGGEPPVLRMDFSYPAPKHRVRYDDFFKCPIRFGAARTRISIAKQWLDAPLRTNDEEFRQICLQHCGQILQQVENSGPMIARLRSLFLKNPAALPRLDAAADELGVSARTLRRHLLEEGTSYQKLVDYFRSDLARTYLKSTGMTPKEIGFLLGFNDPSAFRRAFKLWTGKTINEFRRNAD